MSNPRIRGLIFLVVGSVAAWFLCVFIPFTALPNAGLSIAMPVITVPGEVVHYKWIGDYNLTNTFLGGILAGVLVVMWAGFSYISTNGWTREVPGRWQAWTEFIVETVYNFFEGIGGEKFKKAPLLWPFVAAIFFFLLAGNMGKLLPGVESVGYIHCGYPGFQGYQRIQGVGDSSRLWVDRSLDAGTVQTEELEEACQHQMKVLGLYYGDYNPEDYAEERDAFYARLDAIEGNVPTAYEGAADLTVSEVVLTSNTMAEEAPHGEEEAAAEVPAEPATGSCLAHDGEMVIAETAADEGTHEEEAPADEEHGDSASLMLTSTLAAEEGEDGHAVEGADPEAVAVAFAGLLEAEAAYESGAMSGYELEAVQCEVTRMLHPDAVFPLSSEELRENRIQPYIFTVAPFFRGVSTDLSFNVGLALLSVIAVQIYGVIALGPAYFEKFLNLSAVGNAGKKPMGVIDFVVGLIEIVSELGKIISLAFRLFGNIFAGGIVLVIISFLIAFLLPGVILSLEIIIGTVQALVFAVLTLVFAVQAMEAHHGDDHDDHH